MGPLGSLWAKCLAAFFYVPGRQEIGQREAMNQMGLWNFGQNAQKSLIDNYSKME
jgi:hypothetical protein